MSPTETTAIMAELNCSSYEAALVIEARHAAERSYSPYSKFAVGCALRTPDGQITHGANIENASYGLTICSERCALFAHVAAGKPAPTTLAVTCPNGDRDDPDSNMPCGACRQVMQELLAPGAVILVDHVGRFTLDDLLPRAFRLPA